MRRNHGGELRVHVGWKEGDDGVLPSFQATSHLTSKHIADGRTHDPSALASGSQRMIHSFEAQGNHWRLISMHRCSLSPQRSRWPLSGASVKVLGRSTKRSSRTLVRQLLLAGCFAYAGSLNWALAQDNEVPTDPAADPVQLTVPAEAIPAQEEAPKPAGPEIIEGELRDGDPVADVGGMHDVHSITVSDEERRLIIDLSSSAFDTVLVVEKLLADGTPDPQNSYRNDDSDAGSNSRLDITVPEAGEYRVLVYSFGGFEAGPYRLTIHRMPSVNLNERVLRNEMGSITADDPIHPTLGNTADSFDIEIDQVSRVTLDVWSEEFDTYIMLERIENGQPLPNQAWSNDDYGGSTQHSHIDADVQPGTYRITVAPYSGGLGGNYEMRAIASDIPPNAPPLPPGNNPWVDPFGPGFVPFDPNVAPGDFANRIEPGILNQFDRQNVQGFYYDRFEIDAFQGQPIRITLSSNEFDTVLRVNMLDENDDADPNVSWSNDDSGLDGTNSLIEFVAPFTGVYRITITSLAPNTQGRYELQIAQAPPGGAGPLNVQAQPGQRLEVGNLSAFDEVDAAGRHFDLYNIEVVEGETYTLEVNATGFDPILSVTSDHDEFFLEENDDYEGSTTRSLVQFIAPVSGEFQVRVLSFEAAGEGTYQLTIDSGENHGIDHNHHEPIIAPPNATEGEVIETEGVLEDSDEVTEDGRYIDTYTFAGQAGQQVRIDLDGDEFDAFLALKAPSGRLIEADDFQGDVSRSVLESILSEAGEYQVQVTTYDANETGSYKLQIEVGGASGINEQGVLVSGSQFPIDLTPQTLNSRGEIGHDFVIEVAAGDNISFSMVSPDFDTLLTIVAPDGTEEVYDDASDSNARATFRATQDGRYQIHASSFSRQETGRCTITYEVSKDNDQPNQGKRVLGVFIGIAEYPNGEGDLARCDVDAQRMYDLLRENYGMTLEDSALILNAGATRAAVREALERIGGQATADDMLVFFYSGHGSLFEGPTQPSDPDGLHETITLVDGDLIDDQLADLINASAAGTALIVLDSCYSGGFAKDVVSAPGRMGIFASEEDVLAQVAEDYEAGGYLSRFIVDALLEQRSTADRDKDSQLSAFELCHYLGERYRDEVRSELIAEGAEQAEAEPTVENEPGSAAALIEAISNDKGAAPYIALYQDIDPSEDLSFQRLVVDRGGVKGQTILFAW